MHNNNNTWTTARLLLGGVNKTQSSHFPRASRDAATLRQTNKLRTQLSLPTMSVVFFFTYVASWCSRNNRFERNVPRQSLLLPSLKASAAHLARDPARWRGRGSPSGTRRWGKTEGIKKRWAQGSHSCDRLMQGRLCTRWTMSFADIFLLLLRLLPSCFQK